MALNLPSGPCFRQLISSNLGVSVCGDNKNDENCQSCSGEHDVGWEELSVNETVETRQRQVNGSMIGTLSPGLGSAHAGRVSFRLALQSTPREEAPLT